ncbi:MAG: oxidoreductase [Candidatus Cloacimonetes bacterium HGW-Cloacimonetes-3]|jgi:predicted dehydrogenase|nr:MAG: oxidoreductase [Candidatus Cloacimonetes bacterium HGW-Cloacimonetes-3]
MIKIAVVGVGHLGQHHARKFQSIAGAELVGIYDQNRERAVQISTTLGCKAFESYEAMLDACDAVDIAATTTAHYALAKPALLAGKHIFLEKPITSELAQAEELLEIAEEKGLKIQVGHIERFNPVIREIEHEIGEPMFIESHRLSTFHHRGTDVPVVLDLMIHDIDLILDFVHSPVTEIRASGVGILTPSIDIANARIEFANGAIANVTSSRVSMKQERKIRFFQRDSYISMDFVAKQVRIMKKSANIMQFLPQLLMGATDIKPEQLVDVQAIDVSDSPKDALTMELESFIECIANNTKPIVDGAAGTRALDIALKIIKQIQTKNQSLKK